MLGRWWVHDGMHPDTGTSLHPHVLASKQRLDTGCFSSHGGGVIGVVALCKPQIQRHWTVT